MLEVPAAAAPAVASPAQATRPVLLLREAEPGGFSQSLRLVYSRAPGTQAQYQYAHWNEAPPKRLHTLLRQRLLASGLYAGVLPLGAGVQGDYQLNIRLLDFFHNAAQTPGSARVALEVELVQRSTARLVGQQVFVAEVAVASQTAAAAAAGLGQASGQVLDAVIAWLARVQPATVEKPQAR
ncbi:MAG: ABC-type transport auxiliary lipoprotein family protein [Pseudomonadota bacterium]|nr:ABC-type transport auxiliary lipoprotein family protein [Pseudomonadota bacterium]